MILQNTLFAILTIFSLSIGAVCIHLARRLSCQRKILVTLNMELDAAYKCLHRQNLEKGRQKQDPASPDSPRKTDGENGVERTEPSPYCHVADLIRHGMDADGIAEILDVTPNIARQMIKLSDVARNH